MTLTPSGSFDLPSMQAPSDIVSAIASRQRTVFVAAQSSRGGSVFQYDLDGRLLSTWTAQHILSGLDFDKSANTIYVASYDRPEILCSPISNRGGILQECGEIIGARQLGPVIVDTSRGQLLVGEVQNGEIYSLDLKTHKSRLLTGNLGSPQGLLLSADSKQLLIADAIRRKIYRLDLSRPTAAPVEFSSESVFREPVGLALLSSGSIVVADDRANALFILSPTGRLMGALEEQTLRPFQSDLLKADIFQSRVCIAAGHMTGEGNHLKPFHLYIFVSNQKITSCPNHDIIRDARNQKGNAHWEIHSTGTNETFSFPTSTGSKFILNIKAIDAAAPNVVVDVNQIK
jgi:hypothetical protein